MAQASRGHASLGGGGGGMRMGGGGAVVRAWAAAAVDAVVAAADAAAAAADGDQISRSSTTSRCSVISTTASGFYRFSYNGSDKAYVGVMAQEVQTVRPDAVVRGNDGYLRVFYDRLGLEFMTYKQWIASGSRIPSTATSSH